MLSAGMPELNAEKDLNFMVKKLDLDATEQMARRNFKIKIQEAMDTRSRRIDNLFHNFKACHMK